MADIVRFPGVAEQTEEDDEVSSPFQVILDLEHEIADREHTICVQAMRLSRMNERKVTLLHLCFAVTLAFLVGWILPTAPFMSYASACASACPDPN